MSFWSSYPLRVSRGSRIGLRLIVACCGCLWSCGCRPQAPPEKNARAPLAGTELTLLVAGDEALAKSIALLRGQWEGETESKLRVESVSEQELAAQAARGEVSADAVIYAPRWLGTLAEGNAIRPLGAAMLDDSELDWPDVFELLETREVRWGTDVFAVPLGSPVLLCFYREDLLQALGRQPPRTWQEYQDLAAALAEHGPGNPSGGEKVEADKTGALDAWCGTIEPRGPGWAGVTLLARAAAYARHPNHYSTLFNMVTMEPLIASPPFVRALEEMVAAARLSKDGSPDASPAGAWQALLNNRAGMALCWPAADERTDKGGEPGDAAEMPELGCVEMPGSVEVFNATSGQWERRPGDPVSVPLVGAAGHVGSIAAKSAHPEGAFRLLAWLASRKWSDRALTASADAAPFRHSQSTSPEAWSPGLQPGAARVYVATVGASLSAAECLVAPQLPGADRYLMALDEAVRKALENKVGPKESLEGAAEQFRAITKELGLDRQRDAYQRSLGL
ncbi:MAG TPA: extracellular solute-binding protein [Pirellulales bacterium]|nr:extracellular solute-binding protein [Pirellulales bacterium]